MSHIVERTGLFAEYRKLDYIYPVLYTQAIHDMVKYYSNQLGRVIKKIQCHHFPGEFYVDVLIIFDEFDVIEGEIEKFLGDDELTGFVRKQLRMELKILRWVTRETGRAIRAEVQRRPNIRRSDTGGVFVMGREIFEEREKEEDSM